jgi:hypothetical protein
MVERVLTPEAATPQLYVSEMRDGEILRKTIFIYTRHFPLIASIMIFPMIAFVLARQLAEQALLAAGANPMPLAGIAVEILVYMVVSAAAIVALGDICLGNEASFARSYGTLRKYFWKLFGTFLLASLLVAIGWFLLFIPGIIAYLLLAFVAPVCVLEKKFGTSALRRSTNLTKSHRVRILGILMITYLPFFALTVLLVVVTAPFFTPDGTVGISVPRLLVECVPYLMSALPLIALILLYYDVRVRKENYDAARFAQDLLE